MIGLFYVLKQKNSPGDVQDKSDHREGIWLPEVDQLSNASACLFYLVSSYLCSLSCGNVKPNFEDHTLTMCAYQSANFKHYG